jgi:hypothetical protein
MATAGQSTFGRIADEGARPSEQLAVRGWAALLDFDPPRAATALVIGGPARRSVTGKNALAHVAVLPDYYTRLAILERDAADHLRAQK